MLTALLNADLVDVDTGTIQTGRCVIIEDGVIREIGTTPPAGAGQRIDLAGLTLLPGLIDAHVHVVAYTANLAELPLQSPMYVGLRAAEELRAMLHRGFTTVRDAGGADFGLARAVAEGRIPGPRLLFGGKALSPSGGHGDHRPAGLDREDEAYPYVSLGRRCDGVDAVRAAARDEIRRGANHIKIMANGGISSPTDRITSDQFSESEIAAAVEEAEMADLYVMAHTYTARSVARAVRNGVRSIEHGNLLDEPTVALMKQHGAYLTPTLSVFRALADEGEAAGYPRGRREKIAMVLDGGLRAVEMARRAGVPMAYGTDLVGPLQRYQLREFSLRADVVPPAELIRSATVVGAELLKLEGVGRVAEGYQADLIAVQGNPLEAGVLSDIEQRLRFVMQAGRVARRDF